MINAILLLFSPGPTWKRLASANRAPWLVLVFTLIPVLVVCCGVEGWSLYKFGTVESTLHRHQKISLELASRYATTQVLLALVSSGLASVMLVKIAQGVQIRTTLRQCFSLVLYTLCPVYLFRLADAWDLLNTWVVCAAGVVVVFSVLYTGIVQMLKPDPAKAFGLYLAGSVVLGACHVASHIFSVMVLNETLFKGGLGLGILGY